MDEDDESNMVGNVMSETQQLLQDIDAQRDDVTTAGGKSKLIIPTVFFKQPQYHPLQIFVSISFYYLSLVASLKLKITNCFRCLRGD